MIKYNTTLYEFDPVQSIFHKSNYQTDIEASNEFPDCLRIEKRKIEYLNCDIVLVEFSGIKWNLITGLQPVKSNPGYLLGNKLLTDNSRFNTNNFKNRKREMLLIHNKGLTGQLYLYHFPNYDTRTAPQRNEGCQRFYFIPEQKNRATVETTAPIFLQISMQRKNNLFKND